MRTVVMTLAYHKPEAVEQTMKFHYPGNYERVLVDVSYPLEDPKRNAVALAIIARDNNCLLLRPSKNRGVADNYNWVWNELELCEDDCIIGLDPDCRPTKPGWAEAIAEVFSADPSIGSLHLNRPKEQTTANEWDIPHYDEVIAGYTVRFYNGMLAWSMMAYSGRFMIQSGGLQQENKHYGYIEHWCDAKMKELGMRWGRLMQFSEVHDFDVNHPKVREWKKLNEQRQENSTLEEYLKRFETSIII